MSIEYTPIKIIFKSFKDIEVIHQIHLDELAESIKVIQDRKQLRQATLYLKELLAIVEQKEYQLLQQETQS